MWDLLDDNMLSCIATVGAWAALHKLRQLERRCAQIEKAKTRLQCIRPLSSAPFALRLGRDLRSVVLSARLCGDVLCGGDRKDGDRATQVFATAIASGALSNLTELNLSFNQISDGGMQAFASAVASLPNLVYLDLTENEISDGGMQAFASAVASGALPQLRALMLSGNNIGDGGMQTFAPAFARLVQLRVCSHMP